MWKAPFVTWNRRKRTLGILAITLAATLQWSPARANHSWADYHWARTSDLIIRLGDNVGPEWDTYLRAAALDWHSAAPLDVWVNSGWKNPGTCPPTYGRVEVCNAAYGKNGWLGIGNIWISDGHIVQGTVQLNDTYFSIPFYSTPEWRRFVMCQEIGHVLGLDHQDVNDSNRNFGSCMDYTRDPIGSSAAYGPLNNERPNKHDYDQLSLMYSHGDSSQLESTKRISTSSGAEIPSGARGRRLGQSRVGLGPGEWGRAVAFDSGGRPRIFVRELGGNEMVATFVIWADPDHPHEH